MKFNLENENLLIYIEGRVDTNTSSLVEAEVSEIITNNAHTSVTLDFENVEFLSSAGLRVILRLKKKNPTLTIINVVPEVYEIFEMTGFSEMMNIQKGFRKISVDGAVEIGRGANGIVYRYAEDMIVKVYFNKAKLDDIRNEIRLAKKAFVSGISTAIPFDIVKVGEYYGSMFEMIDAKSISQLINLHPERIDEYVALFIDLLKTINSTIVSDNSVPTIKDKVITWIDAVKDYISPEEEEKLYCLFNGIADDNNMVHRDFHIKNLLMQQDELILIDMDTLSRGNIIFELVGIYNAYKGFVEIKDPLDGDFLDIDDEKSYYIWNKILELYFQDKTEEERKVIENKISVISTVQLLKIHIKRRFTTNGGDRKIALLEEKLHKVITLVDDLNI